VTEYDDPQVVPADGSVEAQPESTQTTEAVVTPQAQPASTLSLSDVERLLAERENKLRAEFDSQRIKWQSKSDKAYADALREAKVIEDNAALLGLEPEAAQQAKRAIINKKFDTVFATPDPEPQPQNQYQPAPTLPPYAATTINEPEIIAALAAEGLEPKDVNYADLLGKPKGTSDVIEAWDEMVTLAKAAKIRAKQQAKQDRAAAQPIAQIRNETGSLGSPSGGAPSAGYNAEQELAKMNAQEPPHNPIERAKWERRMEKLYAEAYPQR